MPIALASVVIPVFRDGARAVDAVRAIGAQALPSGTALEIVVVDDASGDDTLDYLAPLRSEQVRILALPRNQGRSAARNAGAAEARGECIVFMDCDCVPTGNDFVALHLRALAGAVASTGRVVGIEEDFWSRYQGDASARRKRLHAGGIAYSGSSQNLAVLANVFRDIGGFDTGFRKYGFEDRDLLLRLARIGPVAWTEAATVRHRDVLQMRQVARKMAEAGQYSSTRFATLHPDAYSALGFGRLDARRNSVLLALGRIAGIGVPAVAALVDALIALPVPYALKAWAVRLTTALAYWSGTARAEPPDTSPNR